MGLEKVLSLLATPSPAVLHRTALLLESSIALLAAWRNRIVRATAEEARQLRRIRQLAARAAILLHKAEAYHAGWYSYLASRTAGYAPDGAPVPLWQPTCFRLEG